MLGLLFGTALGNLGAVTAALSSWLLTTVAGSEPIRESFQDCKTIRGMQSQLNKGFHGVALGTAVYVGGK